jgi:hypothetical protein
VTKELPLPLQYAVLAALWTAWVLSVTWVELKAKANAAFGLRFDDYRFIHSILFIDMPIVLVCSGVFFLVGGGRPDKLSFGHKILYVIFAGLTIYGTVVLLSWGIWALSLPSPFRE